MTRGVLGVVIATLLAAACGGDDTENFLSREEMLDPETCKDCHPQHYLEWKSSMHAYAAEDPVFRAMNARGQEETGGDLGPFCVQCHAPMAVLEGATTDGLNLDEVDDSLKGVTCFFCHTAESVTDDHNNPVVLAGDLVMRGALGTFGEPKPTPNGVHAMDYAPMQDLFSRKSADLCGPCHDIRLANDVHLERTYSEWQASIFGNTDDPLQRTTCGGCHMKTYQGVAADFEDVPFRTFVHEHSFPGIDVAVTPWPDEALQLSQIERELAPAILPRLCITPVNGGEIEYRLDNIGAGHSMPSGAAHDRRLWAEVIAYSGEDVVFQSGVVPEGTPVVSTLETDPNLFLMRDTGKDADGNEVHMFWEIEQVESKLLQAAITLDPLSPDFDHSRTQVYPITGLTVDRVTARVLIRPIGLEVLQDLIDSEHLDEAVLDESVTHLVTGTVLEWTEERGFGCVCRDGPC